VLVIGAGGLGCPALQYLAAAGTGNIGIVDFDHIELSNLQRQILYTTDDIGKQKAETATRKLQAINPDIKIDAFNMKLENTNALEIISEYDLVIDGSDNFSTRYLINDACVLLDKPFVYGAVLRFEGQVGVFNLRDISGIKTNYRDLFPLPPDTCHTVSCNDAGVLGIVPGIIGTMQAAEAIKIITGTAEPLCNRITSFNVWNNSSCTIEILPDEKNASLIPKNKTEFLHFNYDRFCRVQPSTNEISAENFDLWLSNEKLTIIDVREHGEQPVINDFSFSEIPLSEFEQKTDTIDKTGTIVIFCQTGKRSARAVQMLKNKFSDVQAYNLSGGILAWKNYRQLINS
jgi:adenylyltransferase/sulfurtransferase